MELFDIFINFIESFIGMSFIYFVLRNKKSSLVSLFFTTCIYSINTTIYNYFLLPEILLTITGLLISCAFAFYLNNNRFIQNIFTVLFEIILLNFSVSFAILLTSLFFEFPFYSGDAYIFIVISSKIINAIIVYYSIKLIHKFNLLQTKKLNYILVAMLLLNIIYSSLMDIVYHNSIFNENMIVILFSINFLTFSLAFIFIETKKEQQELLELQRSNLQLESQEKIYKINSENIKELQKWKHDMLHVFNSLSYELAHKNIDKAKNIINEYSQTLDNNSFIFESENSLLNYLLIQKNDEIKNNSISIYTNCSFSTSSIQDTHFFIIVGNLLDNAIENCMSNIQKEIYLSISQNGPFFCIKIKNSIIKPILKNNPNLITSKDNPDNHGIGLNDIKLLLKKYHGKISFEEDQYFFTAKVIIPINQSNNE